MKDRLWIIYKRFMMNMFRKGPANKAVQILYLSRVCAGFNHLLPWYYMIYFIILLVHRDSRDMNECRRKYGLAWDEYCRTVRYRIIPRVY